MDSADGGLRDAPAVDPHRSRWEGPLTPAEIAYCRSRGLALAYDCAQIGWVLATPEVMGESAGASSAVGSPARLPVDQALALVRERFEREARASAPDGRAEASGREVDARLVGRQRLDVARFAETHGLVAADALHWALTLARARTRTGRIEAGPRASEGLDGAPLHDDELGFRPWTLADLPVYRELLGNRRVWRFLPERYPEPFTDETARGLMEIGSLGFLHDAVAIERDGRPIGQCLFRPDDEIGGVRAGEVAYWLGEAHWGQGLMSRILPRFTERCFRTRAVDVLYAWIRDDHPASARVAQKAGYRRDDFPFERALAKTLRRPGFVRFAVVRRDLG